MNTNQPAREDRSGQRSHLFLVRIWKADGDRGSEYRGNVRDVSSGATRSFRFWSDVAKFKMAQVEEHECLDAERAGRGAMERTL